MAEGTVQPSADVLPVSIFDVEYTVVIKTGSYRHSIKFSDFPRVSVLKSLFASVVLRSVVCEVRQMADVGTEDGDVITDGHLFVAIIPTLKDTDSFSGAAQQIVINVPNKQTFPLSSSEQANRVFHFNLNGYEMDLAQEPRRGAAPVACVGNSGITKAGNAHVNIASITWKITVACQGNTPLWQ